MMLSMTCHNAFGRTRLDFVACGCSSNASFDRFSVRNFSKGVLRNADGCKARKSLCHRREIGPCRVFSTKTPEVFLDGIAAGPPPVLDLTKELTKLSSISDLFVCCHRVYDNKWAKISRFLPGRHNGRRDSSHLFTWECAQERCPASHASGAPSCTAPERELQRKFNLQIA